MSFSYTGDTQCLAIGSFLSSVRKIIESEGFHMKEEKTHILRNKRVKQASDTFESYRREKVFQINIDQ